MAKCLVLILLVAILLFAALPQDMDARKDSPPVDDRAQGRLEERDRLRVLYLRGEPYQMGFQQGLLLRDEIRALVRDFLYGDLVLGSGVPYPLLLAHARLLQNYIPHEYREEIQGIAEGAGVSYLDILILHTFPDSIQQPFPLQAARTILTATQVSSPPKPPELLATSMELKLPGPTSVAEVAREQGAVTTDEDFYPCANLAVWGEATRDGKLLHGLEVGYPDRDFLERYGVVVVREPAVGNASITIGWAGMAGALAGLNEEKISVGWMATPSQDTSTTGMPVPFLVRQVLDRVGDLSTALRVVASSTRTLGGTLLIGDGKPPKAVIIEFSAHRYSVLEAEGSFLFHTGHYLKPDLLETEQFLFTSDMSPSAKVSVGRYMDLQERLQANYGWFSAGKVTALLRRTGQALTGRARSIRSQSCWSDSSYSVVMAASDLHLWIEGPHSASEQAPSWQLSLPPELPNALSQNRT